MIWLLYLVAALFLLDALRMRGRVNALRILDAADTAASTTYQVIAAPGVTVSDATRRAACAYAAAHNVDVLDLVPRDLPALRAMTLAAIVDPSAYRTDRLAPGRTAGHAMLVRAAVIERAGIGDVVDEVSFVRVAARLKHYGRADFAIAPDEHACGISLAQRRSVLQAMIGPSATVGLIVLLILWAIIGLGIWRHPLAGFIALASWQLQPLIALAGTAMHSRDLPIVFVLRFPIELWIWIRTVFSRRTSTAGPRRIDVANARRADYAQLIAGGTERFFEARRDTCPLCDSHDLAVHLRTTDLLQHKPGRFTIERCGACSHLFQNPRLSLTGLDYYYKDFYDGLGEAGMEAIFGFSGNPYHARAKMVRDIAAPKRWLDVGGGHGHFCIAAREDLPDTTFDGLDFSESIDEAKRRGWVDNAYRGMLPELAPTFAGHYDAVSMSHYLEHTLDPRAEIEAAHTALSSGGCLLIEVPDPEFRLGALLRRYWLPWFQPQHQHLLSVANLETLLRARGFTPITWHRGQAHQRVDFFFAAYLLLSRLAPSPHLPWRWRGPAAGAWRVTVWTLGSPLIVVGILVDRLLGPLFERASVSNTYRVVARRD